MPLQNMFIPGRWEEVRQPSRNELAGTLALGLPIVEASAKVCTSPPVDDEADIRCQCGLVKFHCAW
jgi:hypothetical protein